MPPSTIIYMGSYFCGSVENAMSQIFLWIYISHMREVDLMARFHDQLVSLQQIISSPPSQTVFHSRPELVTVSLAI